MYYCNKVYPKINLFERKIRQLIYVILIKVFGTEWYRKTVNNNLKNEINRQTKGIKESDLIENALSEMTAFQLEDYLFTPNREIEGNRLIDESLNAEELKHKSKEDIIKDLKKSYPKSLWEKFFEGKIEISNLKQDLEEIRLYRNKVAHSKYFDKNDYDKFNLILNNSIKQIDKAIIDVEITPINILASGEAFIALGKAVNNIYANMEKAIGASMKLQVAVMERMNKLGLIMTNYKKTSNYYGENE